jgi:hypothetical protein
MIHYTCDRCRRAIDPSREMRFTVQISVQAALEAPGADECEADRDHLAEINDMLDDLDLDDDLALEDRRTYRFDLCGHCHRKYVQDPLGADMLPMISFSHN